MTTFEKAARASLIDFLNEELIDVMTGPLSDAGFADAVIEQDGMLSLHKFSIQTFPEGSFDTPQLADAVLRWLAEHDRRVAERAWDEAIQHQWVHRPIGNRSPHNPYRKEQENTNA